MSHYRPITNVDETAELVSAQLIVCPTCNARFMFYRNRAPHIDACGFESYSLECVACGGSLGGIIDPYDETLLLSANESRPTSKWERAMGMTRVRMSRAVWPGSVPATRDN